MNRGMGKTAYIGVGSNMGARLKNCREAVERAGRLPGVLLTARSPFYRTAPVGVEDQDWYVNGVFALYTERPARELLERLLEIEAAMGRVRKGKWGPRPIDLDILLFGEDVIDEADLTVPHPLMHTRRFVLEPMVQLAPRLVHPVLGKSMRGLLADLQDPEQQVIPVTGI